MKVTLTRTWTSSMDLEFSSKCSPELEAKILNEIKEAKNEQELWVILSKYLVEDIEEGFNVFAALGNVRGEIKSRLEVEGDIKND